MPGLVCASEQYPLSYPQGIGIADVTEEKEAATGQEGALDGRQAQCQDSQLFNEGALSHRVPEMSPPSWLAFSLFSFSVGSRHNMLGPLWTLSP